MIAETTSNNELAEKFDFVCIHCDECYCMHDASACASPVWRIDWEKIGIADTQDTLPALQEYGKRIANDAPLVVSAEALADVPYGKKFARQGDLYFAKLATVPPGALPWPYPHGQLAPGATQGSRHCVDLSTVRLWLLPHPTALDGPVIEAPHGVVITHPEHGDHIYPPGVYQVTFQRAYADELRRVQD